MIRKFFLVGVLCAALASCGQPQAPCPTPAPATPGPQSMILDEALVVPAKFSGGRSSFSRSYSRPSYSRPSYSKPVYKRPTVTNNHTTIIQQNSGSSNGVLWGLGGYLLGKEMAENEGRCQ